MIVFIDDEKWIIQGMLDYLTDIADRLDARYRAKHFYRANESLVYIREHSHEINLVITDITMDYGDGDLNREIPGGVLLITKLKSNHATKHIPIIILSIHSQDYFTNDMIYPVDNSSIFYVNRSDNADGDLLYKLINNIIKSK